MPILPSPYLSLVERLNRFPQGAPPGDTLYAILKILFSEREAGLAAQLPIKPFTVSQAARIWKMSSDEARKVLDGLASRAILIDWERDGETMYVLPPPMPGFFEFSLMRSRSDVDQQKLSQLYEQYCTVENEFMQALIGRGQTQVGRIFVNESVLPDVHVLDYERASAVIAESRSMAVSLCFCRHKAKLTGAVCKAPIEDICMSFNGVAESLARHGFARLVDASEGHDLLQKAVEYPLVQFGENCRDGVSFICNCCGCCCEAMKAARRFSLKHPIHTSNFIVQVEQSDCNGCSRCVDICPVGAMSLISASDALHPKRKIAQVDEDLCLGCGLCARVCRSACLPMVLRSERVITPLNSIHRLVLMGIERGNLQDMLFDERVYWSQRTLAAVFGVILRLPPMQKTIAVRLMKSRYLEALIAKIG